MTIGEIINAMPVAERRPKWDCANQLGWLLNIVAGEDSATDDWEQTDPRWRDYFGKVRTSLKECDVVTTPMEKVAERVP